MYIVLSPVIYILIYIQYYTTGMVFTMFLSPDTVNIIPKIERASNPFLIHSSCFTLYVVRSMAYILTETKHQTLTYYRYMQVLYPNSIHLYAMAMGNNNRTYNNNLSTSIYKVLRTSEILATLVQKINACMSVPVSLSNTFMFLESSFLHLQNYTVSDTYKHSIQNIVDRKVLYIFVVCVKLLSMEPVAIPYKRMFMYTKPINALDQLYHLFLPHQMWALINTFIYGKDCESFRAATPSPQFKYKAEVYHHHHHHHRIIGTLYRENHIVLFLYADLPMQALSLYSI